ncbi:MAG: hypothetical protein ACOC2L_02530 [Candidatus Sumerlaeota bacterium]
MSVREMDLVTGQLKNDAEKTPETTAVVLGCFALVHAGTTSLLDAVAANHRQIYVGVLPDLGNLDESIADAAALLKPDERRRLLAAMEHTSGVAMLDDNQVLQDWIDAAEKVRWYCNANENDIGEAVRDLLQRGGVRIKTLSPDSALNTAEVLERMRR